MAFLVRSSLFAFTLISLVFACGCESQTEKKPSTAQKIDQLASEKTNLHNPLEQAQAENSRLLKQVETLSKLPEEKRADALYHIKSIKIGSYTNFYDEDKTQSEKGKTKLVVYLEPIDDTGDSVKAGGEIEVQLWDLSQKENEARLAQWKVEPNELKNLWLGGMLSSGYRLSFDAAGLVDKIDRQLTVRVNFTDYLSGRIFTEQFVIRPPKPAGKK